MDLLVRYFKPHDGCVFFQQQYSENVPVPHEDSYVYIENYPYKVCRVVYSLPEYKEDGFTIDITVKQVTINQDCEFTDMDENEEVVYWYSSGSMTPLLHDKKSDTYKMMIKG